MHWHGKPKWKERSKAEGEYEPDKGDLIKSHNAMSKLRFHNCSCVSSIAIAPGTNLSWTPWWPSFNRKNRGPKTRIGARKPYRQIKHQLLVQVVASCSQWRWEGHQRLLYTAVKSGYSRHPISMILCFCTQRILHPLSDRCGCVAIVGAATAIFPPICKKAYTTRQNQTPDD